tara:strand:- start:669 stop:1151 length:483 start_codon:yes stop_codon:yes gene_type:complete
MKKIFRDIFLYFVLITFMSISNTFAASSDSSSNNFVKSTDYYAAKDFIAKGSYKEAIAILKELEKETPKDADIQNYLGFSYRKMGKLDLASFYYDKALTLNPKHKGALEYQGEMYLTMNQVDKAKENLKRLDKICFLGCKEMEKLELSIKMKLKGVKSKY